MEKFHLIAPCYFGTESTTAFEARRLGAENVQVTDGRVAFEGGVDMIAAANLNLRCAERVVILLKTYTATTFDELFDGVYSIPWEEVIPADAQFPVKGSSLSSQLSSVPACQSIVKKAIVKRLMQGHKTSYLPETGVLHKIRFSIRKNLVEIMLDTSGDGLHKRGYRRNSTMAQGNAGCCHCRFGPCAPRHLDDGPVLRQRHYGDRSRPKGTQHCSRSAPPFCCRAVQLYSHLGMGRAA